MTEYPAVENAEAVTRIFGYWPAFHDAEVMSAYLDRGAEDGPRLELRIHVFHMTNRLDEQGHYALDHHTLVTLQFTNILFPELRGFNNQNVLEELTIQSVDPASNEGRPLRVVLDTSYGLEGEFFCTSARVAAVEPFVRAV